MSCANAVPVFYQEDVSRNIYNILKSQPMSALTIPSQQGFYVFGGMTNLGVSNKLRILELLNGAISVGTPEVMGAPPSPRFLHSTHYLESKALLVILGGKLAVGDHLERDLELFALELVDLRWIRISFSPASLKLATLCAHAAANEEDRIYFFGGVDRDNYRENEIGVIELESTASSSALQPGSNQKLELPELFQNIIFQASEWSITSPNQVM